MNKVRMILSLILGLSKHFKTICKNILKTKVKSKQSKVENNTANLIQSAPISTANLMGKSEHQPSKQKHTKTISKHHGVCMVHHGRPCKGHHAAASFFSGLFTRLQKVHLERCTCIRQLCRQFDRYSFDCSSRHPKKQPTARNLDASKK